MAADKFTFFISFYEALKELPPEDFKKVIIAICEYAFYDKEPDLPLNLIVPFRLIKPIIDKTLKISETRAEQGRKGGAPVGNKNASKKVDSSKNKQNKQNQADKDKEKDKDKGVGVENNIYNSEQSSNTKKKEPFHKPTLEEITAYCLERHNSVNPESFYNHYESNGWKVGNSPMKDWKASIRYWEQSKYTNTKDNKKSYNSFMQNQYSDEDFKKLEEDFRAN